METHRAVPSRSLFCIDGLSDYASLFFCATKSTCSIGLCFRMFLLIRLRCRGMRTAREEFAVLRIAFGSTDHHRFRPPGWRHAVGSTSGLR